MFLVRGEDAHSVMAFCERSQKTACETGIAHVNAGRRIGTPSRLEHVEHGSAPVLPAGSGTNGKRAPYRTTTTRPRATKPAHDPTNENQPLLVASWEPHNGRYPIIEDACAACGARVHRLTTVDQVTAVEGPPHHAAAVVSLREAPDATDCCLAVVTQLKNVGLSVIAYESGVRNWPISARCRVLLAGAQYLLDSEDQGFGQILRATLKDLLTALRERRQEDSHIRDVARSHGIVGVSESLLDAFRSVVRMSTLSDLPVLITGESGTGKELFASALHALDPKRCRRPLVAVNCAAISTGIAESELFGHVRGAYTGAGHDHSGFFLGAQGGVLFLDEIGELNLEIQAKILRVLQEKRFFRVGADQDAAVDIRIVAATNQDLPQMVKEGRFRADLFHRLNTLSIHISPLRERRTDLPLLVDHFVESHTASHGSTGIDADLIAALSCLELKGNVRELKNLLTMARAAKTDRRPLGLKDLPPQVWKELAQSGFAGAAPTTTLALNTARRPSAGGVAALPEMHALALSVTGQQGWNLNQCLSQCEREIVAAALQKTHNNQSQAARLLGLTPRSVYNKLRKHHLLRKPFS